MILRICALSLTMLVCVLSLGESVRGQGANQRLGSEFVPSDAMAIAVLSVSDALNSPATEMYPREIADAWCQQNLGIQARDVDKIKLIVSTPGPAEPMLALIATLKNPVDARALSPKFVDTATVVDVDGHASYALVQNGDLVLHAKDPRTMVVASRNYLATVLRSAEASSTRGPLATMASSTPHTGHLTVLFAVEPIRPMATGMLQAQADQIPAEFRRFTRVPELLDAVLLRVNLEDQANGLNFVMLGRDEATAEELLGIVKDGLEMGRQIGLAQAMAQVEGNEDPVAVATGQYMQRMADRIVQALTPTLDGRRLNINASANQGMATQGVLIGLLLPAVQAAREAARRQTSMNNLKQFGLAMHNAHEVTKKIPGDIYSSDGKPLLSWRVAILPYLEQLELFQQFHLDEPWDSEHNLKLAEQMPMIFVHPGILTPPGTTVYQRPVGENLLMSGGQPISFVQITDGTSNTIMAVETVGEMAVPWTKPADLEINLDNPLSGLANSGRGGFSALFADGSVRFIADAVDPSIFNALLTRDGGEVVQP